jgi:hypothetical protein
MCDSSAQLGFNGLVMSIKPSAVLTAHRPIYFISLTITITSQQLPPYPHIKKELAGRNIYRYDFIFGLQ